MSADINSDESYSAYISRKEIFDTEAEWKATIQRNVEHLEIIKAYKKLDGKRYMCIWTRRFKQNR